MKRPDLFHAWIAAEREDTDRRIRWPADAVPWFAKLVRRKQESFAVLTLDGAHEAIRMREITRGLVNRSLVHPREVFEGAIRDRATAVIIAHNHPSGNVEPSPEDRDVTNRIAAAGKTLGILVLDSMIVASKGYYSFLEQGEL